MGAKISEGLKQRILKALNSRFTEYDFKIDFQPNGSEAMKIQFIHNSDFTCSLYHKNQLKNESSLTMKHYDEDTLLKSVLNLLNDEEAWELKKHLLECKECGAKLEKIKRETDTIGEIDLQIPPRSYRFPRKKKAALPLILKTAAVLSAGFIAGYLTSDMSKTCKAGVVPQCIERQASVETAGGFVVCEAFELGSF